MSKNSRSPSLILHKSPSVLHNSISVVYLYVLGCLDGLSSRVVLTPTHLPSVSFPHNHRPWFIFIHSFQFIFTSTTYVSSFGWVVVDLARLNIMAFSRSFHKSLFNSFQSLKLNDFFFDIIDVIDQ